MPSYEDQISSIHQDLGIPENYPELYQLPLRHEESDLVEIGADIYGRKRRLSREAAPAWRSMRKNAHGDGVVLELVSAFRSVEHQRAIFLRKLGSGETVESILQVSAAPGYSEHHTGRAVDITTSGFEPLVEAFDRSEAFHWLAINALRFDFRMTFPRDNESGIAYEPWHWTHAAGTTDGALRRETGR